jgi:hypothetical protein
MTLFGSTGSTPYVLAKRLRNTKHFADSAHSKCDCRTPGIHPKPPLSRGADGPNWFTTRREPMRKPLKLAPMPRPSNFRGPITSVTRPYPMRAIHLLQKRLRWPPAAGRGLARVVAGRAGGGAWARLYKLPCSISSSAPAMTLSGIELSADGSIRPFAEPRCQPIIYAGND